MQSNAESEGEPRNRDCPHCGGDSAMIGYRRDVPIYRCEDRACPVHTHYRDASETVDGGG